jgi:hypothetical protein
MFKLPDHVAEKYNAARADEEQKRAMFASLSGADLTASARFWMAHCQAPKRFASDEPIYDATFWHVIVPEMLRRLDAPKC